MENPLTFEEMGKKLKGELIRQKLISTGLIDSKVFKENFISRMMWYSWSEVWRFSLHKINSREVMQIYYLDKERGNLG